MKITENQIKRFKELDAKIKAKTATKEEAEEARELSRTIRGVKGGKQMKIHQTRGRNDISFWNQYPELLKDASNVIFNEIAGTPFLPGNPSTTMYDNIKFPTVGIRFRILPVVGKTKSANDAYNYQMRSLWLALHRAYRGVGTYEYPDLGITIFSIFGYFIELARAERIYGVCSSFKAQNRSYPNALLKALGVDPSTVAAAELADFRYQLNRIVSKSQLLCLPQGFKAFEAYISMFSNVFKDAEDVRAQWIVYDPAFRIRYNAAKYTTGGCAEYVKRTANGANGTQLLSDIIADLENQMDALLSDTDIARMCSDILKAFGENGVVKLNYIPEDYVIEPLHEETRLEQMHNSVFIGTPIGGDFSSAHVAEANFANITSSEQTLDLYQENGIMLQSIHSHAENFGATGALDGAVTAANFKAFGSVYNFGRTTAPGSSVYTGLAMLDTWKASPTPDDVVELTRLTVTKSVNEVTISGTQYYDVDVDSYSLYVICGYDVYNADPVGVTEPYRVGGFASNLFESAGTASVGTIAVRMIILAMLCDIDWHPWICYNLTTSGTLVDSNLFWDRDNYSSISKVSLSRLHDACVLSAFKLESMNVVSDK